MHSHQSSIPQFTKDSSHDGGIRQVWDIYSYIQCVCTRIYFEWGVFAMFLTHSHNNATTEIVAQRVWARYIIHIYPNLISVSDPPAMIWLLKGHFPPASHPLYSQPLCLLLRRIYAWTLAILLSRTHDGLHRARERTLRAFWAEVGSGVNGDGVYWAIERGIESEEERAEINGIALSCRECVTFLPCAALESQITVSLVFLITRSLPKRFSEVFNSPVLTCVF